MLARVRGRRHRRGRRLCAHDRRSGRDAAAPRARPRQRAREPAQRAQGQGADRQHRRRPRHLPHQVRRPAAVGHRDGRAQRLGLGADVEQHRASWRRRGAGDRRRARAAGPGRDADPARRRVVERGCRARLAAVAPARRRSRPTRRSRRWCGRSRRGGRTRAAAGRQGAARRRARLAAARLSATTGVQLLAEVFPTRCERGAGLPAIERLAYVPELASVQLRGLKHLVLVDAKAPVSFFAYPGRESYLVPDGSEVHELASPDRRRARQPRGAGRRGRSTQRRRACRCRKLSRPPRPSGPAHRRERVPGDRRAAAGGTRSSPRSPRPPGVTLAACTAGPRGTTGSR